MQPPMGMPPPMMAPPPAPGIGARPILVLITGILYLVVGIVNLATGAWWAGLLFLCGAPFLLIGIFALLSGIGIIMMKGWGWLLGLVFSILGFIWSLLVLAVFAAGASLAGTADVDLPGWWYAMGISPFVLFLVLLILTIMIKKHFR